MYKTLMYKLNFLFLFYSVTFEPSVSGPAVSRYVEFCHLDVGIGDKGSSLLYTLANGVWYEGKKE